jgi:hypothetical protein
MNTDSTGKVPVGCVETLPHRVNETTLARNRFCPCPENVIATILDFDLRPSFEFRVSAFGFRPTWLIILLLTILMPWPAKGDGGVVLLRESQGPFSVTVFGGPERTPDGLSDVSVLVQWRYNGEVVLDAGVTLAVDSPNGLAMDRSEPFCGVSGPPAAIQSGDMREPLAGVAATRDQASNKLLYAATLKLNATEGKRLHVYVVRGAENARFECPLLVTKTTPKSALLWPYLAFPPIVIMAFWMNQWLRRGSLQKGLKCQCPTSLIRAKPRAITERTSKFCFAKL